METSLPGGGRVFDLLAMTAAWLHEVAAERGQGGDPTLQAALESTVGMRTRLLAEIKASTLVGWGGAGAAPRQLASG